MCEIFAEVIEHIFGFEVPEGLELEPFGNTVSEVLCFDFNWGEWSLKGTVGEVV